jgi:methylmalonyl-CoA/ethylmalonyl-CoA epimerase
MKIKRIDHVAIASALPDEARSLFTELMGIEYTGCDPVEREGVNTHFFRVGESNLEVLEPLGADSTVARFLEKRGSGLHHISLAVEGLDDFVVHLKTKGIQFTSEEPGIGAHGKRIIFIHPKSAGGVLLELCEEQTGTE